MKFHQNRKSRPVFLLVILVFIFTHVSFWLSHFGISVRKLVENSLHSCVVVWTSIHLFTCSNFRSRFFVFHNIPVEICFLFAPRLAIRGNSQSLHWNWVIVEYVFRLIFQFMVIAVTQILFLRLVCAFVCSSATSKLSCDYDLFVSDLCLVYVVLNKTVSQNGWSYDHLVLCSLWMDSAAFVV